MDLGIRQKYVQNILLLVVPLIAIFITPWGSADPVNQSKMSILVPSALLMLGILVSNFKSFLQRINKNFALLITLFICQLIFVVILSPGPYHQQFYGTFGRNTGFLTYASLAVLALCASVVTNLKFIEKLCFVLLFTGLVSAVYCALQTLGLDPIKWSNPYNAIVGFLGNPNFASSFLGISGIVGFSYLLQKKLTPALKTAVLIYIASVLVLIIRSHSQQGIMVFGAGGAIVLYFYIIGTPKFAKKRIEITYLSLVAIVGTFVILGMLNIGPLANYIYKLSVRQRGFYWHAAIQMMKTHPLTGVGLDSYGDWYLGLRSANAAFLTPLTTSNEAHNVFLNLGAVGGAPLFFINICLGLITLWSVIKYTKKNKQFNWAYAGLVGAWFGYEAQCLISINQIGLAVWGWLLMGALVGIEFSSRKIELRLNENIKQQQSLKKSIGKTENLSSIISLGILGACIGLSVTLPVFIADANFRSGLQSKSAEKFIAATLASPRDNSRMIQAAQVLAKSNLIDQAKTITNLVLQDNPRFYNAWELKLQLEDPMKDPNSKIAAEIKRKMHELNPKITIE